MKRRLLLIEDDADLRAILEELIFKDYEFYSTDTLKEALVLAQSFPPDLVLLDLALPDGNGRDFLKSFRKWSAVPILVLSAQGNEQNKVELLDLGADDFLDKPFAGAELLARIRALMRRAHIVAQKSMQWGPFSYVAGQAWVLKNGVEIHLTQIEQRILEMLIESPGKVVSHRTFMLKIWGPSHELDTHYLRIYIRNLRQKIEDDPVRPVYLRTELGLGYRFVLESE